MIINLVKPMIPGISDMAKTKKAVKTKYYIKKKKKVVKGTTKRAVKRITLENISDKNNSIIYLVPSETEKIVVQLNSIHPI